MKKGRWREGKGRPRDAEKKKNRFCVGRGEEKGRELLKEKKKGRSYSFSSSKGGSPLPRYEKSNFVNGGGRRRRRRTRRVGLA